MLSARIRLEERYRVLSDAKVSPIVARVWFVRADIVRYYLFLLISVLLVFLLTTTYLALIRDLADSPQKIPEKLAAALQAPNARNFMVSYVMLQCKLLVFSQPRRRCSSS